MSTGQGDTGDLTEARKIVVSTPLAFVLCLVGTFVLGVFPYYGFIAFVGAVPLAYGSVVLFSRERVRYAYLAIVIAGAADILLGYAAVTASFLLGLTVVTYVRLSSGRHEQARFFGGILVGAGACLAGDLVAAYVMNLSFSGQINAVLNSFISQLTLSGTVPAEVIVVLKRHAPTLASLWPSLYAFYGMVFMLVVALVGRLARKHCQMANRPTRLVDADLSIHVLWLPIGSMLCLAASYFAAEGSRVVSAVGYNLALCSVFVLAIQGFVVIVALMNKRKWHWAVQAVVLAIAVQLELMFVLPSIIGLLDFWVNFRKLPREKDKTADATGN